MPGKAFEGIHYITIGRWTQSSSSSGLVLNARQASTRLAAVEGTYNSARGRIGQQMTYRLINNVAYRFST